MYKSVFDIPIKDKDGNPNMLEQYRGKALMFVNTTGHCGNAGQWPILNSIMDEYRDKDFQIIYVPTNDYCGSVTVAPYKNGIKDATESFEYANQTYNITDPFTELLSSRDTPWEFKLDEFLPSGDWAKPDPFHETIPQTPKSDLYKFLNPDDQTIGGNFKKIITNAQGVPVAWISNPVLNNGPRWRNNIHIVNNQILLNRIDITELIQKHINLTNTEDMAELSWAVRTLLHELGVEKIKEFDNATDYWPEKELIEWDKVKDIYPDIEQFRVARAKQDVIDIKNAIDEVLATGQCTNSDFAY